jgi:hypothetical protein
MSGFYVKLHESFAGNRVLAVSDSDILGKEIEDSDLGLFIKISEEFYGGESVSREEALNRIRASDNVNVIGTRIVDAMIEERIIDSKSVTTINGVKHAQVYRIN